MKLLELAEFCMHLAAFDKARLPLLESMHQMAQMPLPAKLKAATEQVVGQLSQGYRLSQSLAMNPAFGTFLPALMAVAEKVGTYAPFLEQAQTQFKWQQDLQQTTATALRYPLILLFLLGVMLGVTVHLLVPGLEAHLKMLGVKEHSFFTWSLLVFTEFMSTYGGWILLFVFVCAVGMRFVVPYQFAKMLLKIPVVGSVILDFNNLIFFHLLATMGQANVHLLEAVSHASKAVKNRYLQEKYAVIGEMLTQGKTLSEAVGNEVPAFFKGYIELGEKTGSLAPVLLQACEHHGHLLKRRLDKILSWIQPSMVMFMGGLLIWMILAVLLPLYDNIQELEW